MSKAEGAVAWAIAIANNPAHGYDQTNRWGPDYDCSSLIISAWESVGVSVREAGASYTGNMRRAFLACGFTDVTAQVNLGTGAGLKVGDVLLNDASHTVMYAGNGRVVAARANEQGKVSGGAPGDQTGQEICQQGYYNYPWNIVLRYQGAEAPPQNEPAKTEPTPQPATGLTGLPMLSRGSKGDAVIAVQGILIARKFNVGPDGADGDFGYNTWNAVCRFQKSKGLLVDGVVGPKTWAALLGVRA